MPSAWEKYRQRCPPQATGIFEGPDGGVYCTTPSGWVPLGPEPIRFKGDPVALRASRTSGLNMYTSRQGLPRPTLGLQAGAGGVVNPGSGNGGPNVIPSAPSGGAPWSDFVGELGTEIAKEGIGIVGDWIRSRLGGSSESTPADQVVPSNQPLVGTSTSKCGPGQIPFGQSCIDPLALPPGGKPAVTGAYTPGPSMDGYGAAVMGLYGLGLQPRVEVQTVRRCPGGMALGKDGICYEGLHRNSPRRAWPMGMKPLMTGGDRAAIAKAKRVATKLAGARKSISKTAKALAKAGC